MGDAPDDLELSRNEMHSRAASRSEAEFRPVQAKFTLTPFACGAILAAASLAASGRLIFALVAARRTGDLEPLTSYGFTVVFPLVLIGFLLSLAPGRTREGALMRIGAAIQLIIAIVLRPFALHLVLGLPVVFLLVELFETRLKARLRETVAAWWVRCS